MTFAVLSIVSIWLLCWYAIDIILLVFAGLLFGVFLRALADLLTERTRLSESGSLVVVVLAVSALLLGAGWFLFASVAAQLDQLAAELPRALDRLEEAVSTFGWGAGLLAQLPRLEDMAWDSLVWRRGVLPATLGTTLAIVSGGLVVVFVGLYFAAQPDVYRRGLLHLIPVSDRRRVSTTLDEVGNTLRWWIVGQSLAMTAVGVLTVIGLGLLGVDFALALGVLAGMLAFVPYIGPIVALVPAALIALVDGVAMGLSVIALYVGIQTLESYVLTPNIHRKTVSLPPILTLGAQLVLGALVGTLGLLLATPLVAIALPMTRLLYVEDVLGENLEDEVPPRAARRKAAGASSGRS
jgi:predicted PurR-regulated permease PerM